MDEGRRAGTPRRDAARSALMACGLALIALFAPSSALAAWLITVAGSRQLATALDGRVAWELEGQAAYHFGDQSHWEFNLPVMARWQRFAWSDRLRTTAAFGLGLSWATEVPETEVRLEGTSAQWLVYWVLELTAGPPDARWDVSSRIHHRSKAFGLFGEAGGMNAVTVGVRYRF
jgi:hypothetical protein